MKKLIRENDKFGHKIGLNFDKNSEYQTKIGGIATLLLQVVSIGYTITKLIGMKDYSYNTIGYTTQTRDYDRVI